jgi:hypothetical protein
VSSSGGPSARGDRERRCLRAEHGAPTPQPRGVPKATRQSPYAASCVVDVRNGGLSGLPPPPRPIGLSSAPLDLQTVTTP